MTQDEKELMALTIETAMLKGFEKFAETMDTKISKNIDVHKQNCIVSQTKSGNSFFNTIKDWKTIAATILAIAWIFSSVISGFTGKPQFTVEQAKQIAQQVENLMSLDPNIISPK